MPSSRFSGWEMTSGRYKRWFWAGAVLMAVAAAAPWLGRAGEFGPAAGVVALIGLLCYEHAYVQGGQAVPLA